jgi:hypothetical protein
VGSGRSSPRYAPSEVRRFLKQQVQGFSELWDKGKVKLDGKDTPVRTLRRDQRAKLTGQSRARLAKEFGVHPDGVLVLLTSPKGAVLEAAINMTAREFELSVEAVRNIRKR